MLPLFLVMERGTLLTPPCQAVECPAARVGIIPPTEEMMAETMTRLPPRETLAQLALDQAVRAYPSTVSNGESTVLSSSAHGGVTGFINTNFFPKESPRSFIY